MQVDERDPGAVVAHACHRFARVGAWATAIVALFAASFPYAVRVIHNIWQVPHATITYVTWTTMVEKHGPCSMTVTANGTADHIPAGDDLWLVARSNKNVWYPISPITHRSGNWAAGGTVGTSHIAELDLRMISQANDGKFVNAYSKETVVGFNNAPTGPPPLSSQSVNERPECQSVPTGAAGLIIRALTR